PRRGWTAATSMSRPIEPSRRGRVCSSSPSSRRVMGQRAEEVLTAARVITPDQVHAPGWLAVEDGNVTALGSGTPPSPARDLGPVTITPGFIDLHCHGGSGASFGE